MNTDGVLVKFWSHALQVTLCAAALLDEHDINVISLNVLSNNNFRNYLRKNI